MLPLMAAFHTCCSFVFWASWRPPERGSVNFSKSKPRLPFLVRNEVIIDHTACTGTPKSSPFNLLLPPPLPVIDTNNVENPGLNKQMTSFVEAHACVMTDLMEHTIHRCNWANRMASTGCTVDLAAAVWQHIQGLAVQEQLAARAQQMVERNAAVFNPIPHADTLPSDVWCRIRLKDAQKQIST